LGYFWSLLNPLLNLVILSVVFSHFVGRGMKDYTLYLFSGLIAWTFFHGSLLASSTSLLENENFIKKIYLPKTIFPLSKVLLRGLDFLLSFVALTFIGFFLHIPFHPTLVAVPLAALSLFVFTWGLSMVVSVATIYFRDAIYLLTVFLQLLYFVTPILYPESTLPAHYLPYLQWNPLYWQLNLFHDLVYLGELPSRFEWAMGAVTALGAFVGGLAVLVGLEEDLVFRM
jgi:ABC-2 type transport system permease protein/lipopolysaccharide transport system permease protein